MGQIQILCLFTDTVGTLDLTGPATIHLDADGNIAFANSSAVDWTNDIVGGGTLNITGTFVSGSSLRFGNTNAGLTPQQLALITAEGFGPVTALTKEAQRRAFILSALGPTAAA